MCICNNIHLFSTNYMSFHLSNVNVIIVADYNWQKCWNSFFSITLQSKATRELCTWKLIQITPSKAFCKRCHSPFIWVIQTEGTTITPKREWAEIFDTTDNSNDCVHLFSMMDFLNIQKFLASPNGLCGST